MNLNDYFDPVSLEKPEYSHLDAENTVSASIQIHTPDNPIRNLGNYDIAIFGVKEDRRGFIKGTAESPDKIREKFYLLAKFSYNIKIIDLGNVKKTDKVEDSYFALRDILLELKENSVTAVALGGSQDLTLGFCKVFEAYTGFWNLTTVDSRLDYGNPTDFHHSGNFLNALTDRKKHPRLTITNIGHQTYFTPHNIYDKFDNEGHTSIRLGVARANLSIAEPFIRDCHIFSVDMAAVRNADAPGGSNSSPNGFFAYELCQLTRFAGAAANLQAILFSEMLADTEPAMLSAEVYAEALWYFIDGFSIRIEEDPRGKGMKKFIVSQSVAGQDMIFYKSRNTNRWWMELPVQDPLTGKNLIISCPYEDYQQACNNEIPDRWWKIMKNYS